MLNKKTELLSRTWTFTKSTCHTYHWHWV